MVKDFFVFVKKLFFGQYDEMGWEDMFHGVLFIIMTSTRLRVDLGFFGLDCLCRLLSLFFHVFLQALPIIAILRILVAH